MTITAVGSFVGISTGTNILSVSPTAVGDILLVAYSYSDTYSSTYDLTSVSGGGVTTWSTPLVGGSNAVVGLAWGIVTSTGSSTITITNAGATYSSAQWGVQQFHSSVAGTWAPDGTAKAGATSGTSIPYPSITPTGTGELYFGVNYSIAATSGGTSGFTYLTPYLALTYGNLVYGLNVSSPTAAAPALTQSVSYSYASVAICLKVVSATSGFFNFM